jgi:hypothetical protein
LAHGQLAGELGVLRKYFDVTSLRSSLGDGDAQGLKPIDLTFQNLIFEFR